MFTFVGSIPDKDDLIDKIEKAGGSVVTTLSKKVTHVITTYEDVTKAKLPQKLTNAMKQKLPILDPHFIGTYSL